MEEGGAAAGLIGVLLIAMRVIERSVDKKNGSNGTAKLDTRMALAEQQLAELKEDIAKLTEKVVENLKLTYELREKQIVQDAVNEALKHKGNGQHDPGGAK